MMSITQKSLFGGLILGLAMASGTSAYAQKKPLLDRNKFSVGAGVSRNSVDAPVDDETGFQFFGAYSLNQVNLMHGVDTSLEFGYMDYGFDGVDNDGIWATAVVDGKLGGSVGWLARLGFDFGDDSGLMLGAGLGFAVGQKAEIRTEYVIRDEIDSIQLNLIYRL